jgi:hypothetical protein
VDVELRETSEAFLAAVRAAGGEVLQHQGLVCRVKLPGAPDDVTRAVFAAAEQSGAQVRGYAAAERSLEEAFLEAVHG